MLLDRGLGVIWVEGELSNFSQPASGHWYFSLKDRDAQLRCAMFRMKNALVGFTPQPGAQLLVRGRISVYEARGEYQLIVEHLEEAGTGRAQARVRAPEGAAGGRGPVRARAQAAACRASRAASASSPRPPGRRCATSCTCCAALPAGAGAHLSGPGAGRRPRSRRWSRALQLASARAECDVLILARGGGSLEDLWAFNDERLARAIHACALPVVCGVGHEMDFTIADFVADARAPTPSAAAELVVPDRLACLEALGRSAQRLQRGHAPRTAPSAARAWRTPSGGCGSRTRGCVSTSRCSAWMTWRCA